MNASEDINHAVLGIETAGRTRSVALATPAGLVAEISINADRDHSRQLLPEIEALLEKTATGPDDLAAIAVSSGPGSFTGLRIGMACAKGLARSMNLPLFTVPTLDGLAAQAGHSPLPICAVSQARKNELYLGRYQSRFPALPERTGDYLALAPAKVTELIKTPTLFIGVPGYEDYGLETILGENFIAADPRIYTSRAAAIATLALGMLQRGEKPAPDDAEPLYVKVSQAEENLRAET